jgi:DNA repair exonuclease SbcCD ATPase subunit
MSLSKIGKITNALKGASTAEGVANLAATLKSTGDVTTSATILGKYFTQSQLSPEIRKQAMLQAYGEAEVTEDILKAAGAGTTAKTAGTFAFGASNLIDSLKNAGKGLLTVIKPILPILGVVAAIGAGKMIWNWADDKFTLTKETADKKSDEAHKTYTDNKTELDSLQSQYDSNQDRIYELRAKQNKSANEAAELKQLQAENNMLGTQVNIQDRLTKASKYTDAKAAKTALEKKSQQKNYDANLLTENGNQYVDDIDEAADMISYLNKLKEDYQSNLEEYEKYHYDPNKKNDIAMWGKNQTKKREVALKQSEQDLNTFQGELSEKVSKISEDSQRMLDENGDPVDSSFNDVLGRVDNLLTSYYNATNSSSYFEEKLNNIFAKHDFKNIKDDLLKKGKSGGSDAIKDSIKDNQDFVDTLTKYGISIDDLAKEIMSEINPDAIDYDGIRQNLKDTFSYKNGLYDFFKDKPNEDVKGFWDYIQANNYNPKEYDWGKAEVSDIYDEYQKSKEDVEIPSSTFSSLFKNSAEDTSTDLDTITDNFQTDMSNIKSAMDSIKSGTFQNSDITDLIQQFPELATETDNLQQGLQKLTFDKASTAIGKIRDSVKDVTDPKELAAADKYIQSIMDTMDLSDFDVSNSKHTKDTIISNLKGDSIGPIKSASLINQLFSEYGDDKVAMQAIMKLSLDPSMANADLDTWKSKIEDTKVQIQLDTSAKNLDNLSKELTRLQTDASDQQTRLNNKSAYNMKATASDYTNLIENGDKQIENLNNQIKEYQNNIDALKNSKGLSPLSDEDNEQIKQWQDQIQASQMSIENMKASQADWRKTAFNLPVTDMQNTVTALTSAISEMQTETGLTSDTMDSLRTQFSDLKDAHVDNVFDRTAKGLKINTERMKDYLEQQNEFMNSDFAQRIHDYQDQLSAGNKDYTQQGLENLKNLQAQYFAQYQEAAKQFSDFQAMVNADNLSTEGNEYTTAKSYLDNAKDLYDKGLVGTPQFKAAAKYFSQNGFEDADNFIENYNKLKNYYTDDASGPKRFLSDLEAKGLATYKTLEDGNQQWMYSFTDTQEAADAMGMSLESFESMFGRLKDYGDTNNFVSSLEEGALKSEEIDDKLIDAQIKMGKLKASGANQSALDDQQAVIDNLIAQKTGITQAISDFKDGTVDRKIQDIKDAKGAIDELNQAMKDQDINPDSDAGKKYIEAIQEQADKVGLKLTNFEVDEDAYNQLIAGYEAKAKGSQIKHFQDVNEGIESGNTGDYADSDVELVNKIKDAQEQKSETLQNVIDAVNSLDKDQWNEANQIELGNGAYESEDQGIRNVEDALQGLSDQFGLTKEQATALLPALEALGVVNIDPNVDTSGIDELDQATQDGMASLRQMKADGDIDLSFEIDSSTDGLTIDELQSQIDELEKAKVKLKLDVDSPEYNAIQSMIDQRETQIHLQVLMDQSTDIDKWLALANGEDGDKQLAIAAGIDLNDEDAQSKIDALKASLKSLSGDTPAISVKIDETQFQALTKEQQGQGTVTFKPEHKEVDAYLAEEKKSEGKVKWSNETGLVDVYAATEHYSHGTVHWGNDISAVQTSFTANGTVNWINSGGPSGGLSKEVKLSSGTFKAESTGSAYNVLNITPAHASGTNVAIKQDQQALVNEVGVNGHAESIVRDGVWSLIPGGAHIENLKKGDIIFSTTQTDALLKHGAIQGHARAYASGTVTSPGVMKAYAAAGNTPGFHFQGGAATVKPAGSGNSGNSGNSGLQHAIEDNTDAVSNNSDDTSDAADEVSEALQNVIKKLNDNAMDWVEVAMDRLDRITSRYTDLAESDYSHYTKAQKYYNKALENTDKEIKAAKESISVYKRKSEEVANNGEVSKYLTPALKKKVQDGTINIETLDANQKAAVEAYKQWYDKYLDAVQKYRDKKTQELDLAKSKVDNVYDSYDLIISKRKAKEEYYAAKAENRIKSGKSQKVGSVYWKDLKKQVSYAQYQKDWMLKERDKVQQSMTDYLNVNGHNKKDKAYQEMKKNLTDLNTSIVEADTHIQETKAALEETRENLKQWQIDRWERAGDKQDASLSYKKNADDINYQLSANDYEERLKTYDKIIRADEEKRQLLAEEIATKTWSNEETQKKIEEYDNLTASIIKSKEAMQQLAQEEIDFRFKPLDEAQNKLSNLVSELQTAQKLLGDTESFYNDDGAFSTNGLTNILLVQEQIDATKDKIANYREGLNKLDEMYKNGAIGPEYYKTKTDEMLKSLQQESATLADLKQNLLDMYTTQVTKENDLLQENIEKRKDALAAKEKYYDYDKTLKKKTKDINTLKAQIAALEGTSNAASKARLEKLRAELADAEDDMADTMHQHEVDMKNTGYENFSDEANKALDNTLDAVKKNAAFQEAIIGSMLSNVKANYDSTYKHLGDVMDQYGMKVSQTYSQMITKAADFNTAAVNATKAWEGVTKIDTSKPYGGSSAGNSAFDSAMNNAGSSQNAGSPNIKPDTDYTLKLSDTDIYLTYSHIKKQLKATWSPKKPEHSDIEWKSSDESIAKVSSDGTVRGVSSGLNKNGLMARDESKTRKCIITAIGGGGLAKATCTVHVMPDSHYEKIKDYADKAGIKDTSGNNLRDAMEYAYKNGANHSDQSYTAVEGFKKAYLKDWTNSLSNRPDGATDVPAGVSPLIGYFNAKGKKVGPKEMQQLADILQINTPGVKKYDSWGSTLKNKILKAYKSYGFSKGGVVRKGIPASILDIIGGDALIPRGDSMLIGANPGETVLTKEFTDQLKPTVATLNEFNARMAKPITTILPSSSNDTSVNSECNITINVDKINNEQDIKKLAYQIGDIITERNKRDWKKVR